MKFKIQVFILIKWDGTLQDLINEAGGLTNDADVTNLTLLQRVEADSTMFIPSKEETQQLISINSASKEELCRLPKIGPAIADRIIAYRQQKPFSTIEEIMNVKGIGQKMFDGIKQTRFLYEKKYFFSIYWFLASIGCKGYKLFVYNFYCWIDPFLYSIQSIFLYF